MVVVQGSERQVMAHMADYTGHTCMDYSLLASASGNTLGNLDKLGKEVPVPVMVQCLMHQLPEQKQQQELQQVQMVLMQKENCLPQKSPVAAAVLVAVV